MIGSPPRLPLLPPSPSFVSFPLLLLLPLSSLRLVCDCIAAIPAQIRLNIVIVVEAAAISAAVAAIALSHAFAVAAAVSAAAPLSQLLSLSPPLSPLSPSLSSPLSPPLWPLLPPPLSPPARTCRGANPAEKLRHLGFN